MTKKHKKTFIESDLVVLKDYWLSGFDGNYIAVKLECKVDQIDLELKKMALLNHNQTSRGRALNGNEVLRFETRENLIKFLRERQPKSNETTVIEVMSDHELLLKYGIHNYQKFVSKLPNDDGKKQNNNLINRKKFVSTGMSAIVFLIMMSFYFGYPITLNEANVLVFAGATVNSFLYILIISIFCIGLSRCIFTIYVYLQRTVKNNDATNDLGFERWNIVRTNRLKLLANFGYELNHIGEALRGVFYSENSDTRKHVGKRSDIEDIDTFTEASVRAKLVQLGLYRAYQEKNWDYQENQLKTLSKKLKKDFGNSVPKRIGDRLKDPKYIKSLISHHENKVIEFKETFFVNNRTTKKDPVIIHAALKAICGFLNTTGGTLLIGVKDNQTINGIFDDNYTEKDKYKRDIQNRIKATFGLRAVEHILIEITKMPGSEEICAIQCEKSASPVWCIHKDYNKIKNPADADKEIFYVRNNAETVEYPPSKLVDYVKRNWE